MWRSVRDCAGYRRLYASTSSKSLESSSFRRTGSTLHGFEIATVLTRLNMPQVLEADHTVLAPDAEAAQPLYARYWLHNRGPAPLGGLPAVAYLHPQQIAAEPNTQAQLRLTTASDCSDTVLHGGCAAVPDGWTADPAELPFMLPPGGHLATDVVVNTPSSRVAGPVSDPGGTRTDRPPRFDAAVMAPGGRGRVRRIGGRAARRQPAAVRRRSGARRRQGGGAEPR